jgi:DNA processing protein
MMGDPGRERAFWVALSQVAHMGPVRVRRMFEHFGSLETAWGASSAHLGAVLDARSLQSVENARRVTDPEALLRHIEGRGMRVVAAIDPDYPELLSHISAGPPVLYVRGTLEASDRDAVAIVGTRRASAYGRDAALEIGRDLGAAGVTVVSGLARGVDGAAHQGALEGGGRTIAVLASGVDVIYPSEHRRLAERIIESGALVSDYPPGAKPDAVNFPARNRIISGLSRGTLVIEAPERSGALITVDFAADQGREVFVVPGNVFSPASKGSNRLLRDGARAVMSADDILEDLGFGNRPAPAPEQEALPATDEERRILSLITQRPAHIDEIVAAANIPAPEGAALLTMLELKGMVRNTGAQHYVRLR